MCTGNNLLDSPRCGDTRLLSAKSETWIDLNVTPNFIYLHQYVISRGFSISSSFKVESIERAGVLGHTKCQRLDSFECNRKCSDVSPPGGSSNERNHMNTHTLRSSRVWYCPFNTLVQQLMTKQWRGQSSSTGGNEVDVFVGSVQNVRTVQTRLEPDWIHRRCTVMIV